MDRKENQLMDFYYDKFAKKNFDEKDLYSFLLLVRESAKDIRCIRELGDFIAHREKSKGYVIKDYLEESERVLNNLGKEKNTMKIDNVFSFKEIRNGFNSLFQQIGYSKLPNETINDFVLCIISLLQDVKIISSKSKREIGKLSFGVSSKEIFLMGSIKILNKDRYDSVMFPVLSVDNIYEEVKPSDKYDTPYLFSDEIIEVFNVSGKMVITFPK